MSEPSIAELIGGSLPPAPVALPPHLEAWVLSLPAEQQAAGRAKALESLQPVQPPAPPTPPPMPPLPVAPPPVSAPPMRLEDQPPAGKPKGRGRPAEAFDKKVLLAAIAAGKSIDEAKAFVAYAKEIDQ